MCWIILNWDALEVVTIVSNYVGMARLFDTKEVSFSEHGKQEDKQHCDNCRFDIRYAVLGFILLHGSVELIPGNYHND